MELVDYLQLMIERQASDLLFSADTPPTLKVDGNAMHLGDRALSADEVNAIAYAAMNEAQQSKFKETWEMNLALSLGKAGRFRVNLYRQRGEIALAIRYISNKIPSIAQLNLPPILQELVMLPRGLVLVVGSTGSGKSTTLAAMIDYRNARRTGHILTVEEPIEYAHVHKRSQVDQREVGLDTHSYADALKNAMRQAPDVIMIGEIRDRETMQAAIAYAETGHLCLSTLHANNANQTLDRIINFFPDSARTQLLIDLSLNLKAVVSQRLLRGSDGKRVPAVELLLSSPYVSDLIAKGEIALIKDAIKQSRDVGMQSFDQALFDLYVAGRIGYQEAIDNADSRTDLALEIRLHAPAREGDPESGIALEDKPQSDEEREAERIAEILAPHPPPSRQN
ncbi:MAG TPA: PilT/PilU family type 4a pilus ATPase [Arenimonas sp.]|nr:PilT/PilU family type 4a pilus ATPase [Arenimonas sp.]